MISDAASPYQSAQVQGTAYIVCSNGAAVRASEPRGRPHRFLALGFALFVFPTMWRTMDAAS